MGGNAKKKKKYTKRKSKIKSKNLAVKDPQDVSK
jgi:hypothetical protein